MDAWAGCLGGALEDVEYQRLLHNAGFSDVEVEVTRVYGSALACCDDSSPQDLTQASAVRALDAVGGRFVSAFVRARKTGATEFLRSS